MLLAPLLLVAFASGSSPVGAVPVSGRSVSTAIHACTGVAIPELVVTLQNEQGRTLVGGHIPWSRASTAPPSTTELQQNQILAIPTGKLHTYDVYITRPWYENKVLRNVVVEWQADGCHPITRRLNVLLKLRADSPPVREFRLTGMGRPFGIFLDANAEVVRQGVTWASSRPDIAPVDPQTGTLTPKCLQKRAWTKLTATLKADPRYQASASLPIEPNMRGCRE